MQIISLKGRLNASEMSRFLQSMRLAYISIESLSPLIPPRRRKL